MPVPSNDDRTKLREIATISSPATHSTIKIAKVADTPLVLPGEEIKAIIYGDSGAGKTEFLSSAVRDPRTAPVVWVDLEGGTKTIRSKCRYLKDYTQLGDPQPGLIDVIRIETFKDFQNIYNWLFDAKYRDNRAVYRSCCVDSLTEINQIGLKHVMDPANSAAVKRLEVDVPEQRDYLKTNSLMKDMMRGFRDIKGLHVFYSALAQVKEMEKDSKVFFIQPDLIGKLAAQAVSIVDYAGYLRVKMDGKREMIFQPEGRIIAKERSEMGFWIEKLTTTDRKVPLTITQLLDTIEELDNKVRKQNGSN